MLAYSEVPFFECHILIWDLYMMDLRYTKKIFVINKCL